MLKIIHKRPPLNIFVVSKTQHVNLKEATKFDNSLSAINFARSQNHFAFHVKSKDAPQEGLIYTRIFPLKGTMTTAFGQKIAQAYDQLRQQKGAA
jgi:hypothetical protein